MTAIVFADFRDERAERLGEVGQNGLRLALVDLPAGPGPDHADVELHFWNALHLAALQAEVTANPARASQIFSLRGGTRLPAGRATGQVQVTAVTTIDATRLSLRVEPVGDYSTYTLELVWDASRIDPFFSTLGFKFRPGCFTNDCAPALPGKPRPAGPTIDYLAKDYDSFRHTLMVAMAERVPGWTSTSEADHDQVLIDLFAAAADELSDYQDRVMAESTLATARRRVTLARQARLMDYHLHEGNQASTWLVLELLAGVAPFSLVDQELLCWTGSADWLPESVFFSSRERRLDPPLRQRFDPLVNRLRLHTWGHAQPALAAGSTGADLVPALALAGQAEADALRDLVRSGQLRQLLVAEMLNPLTGRIAGRKRGKRQLLRLLSGDDAAETIHDSVTGRFIVRLHWREDDALRHDYSFTTFCDGTPVEDVSMFFGNLLPVYEGRPIGVHFFEEGTELPSDSAELKHRHYQRTPRLAGGQGGWVLAILPEGPLAYTPTPPGGEVPARSTLQVEVEIPLAGSDTWDEVSSLVHSDDSAENGDHFMVETDERQLSSLRFGNGSNGQLLAAGAIVRAEYQIGGGVAGNVGADQLVFARDLSGTLAGSVQAVWNPFDVRDGRAAEPVEQIRRNAPEAYRARQLRAVTLADYAKRAMEVDGVSRAVARYAWTGSWRTVRIAIDPAGFVVSGDARSDALWDELRPRIAAHLEAVRLIGEDLELRPPRYVPLALRIRLCAASGYWLEDLRFVLEQEFSDGWTSDGRPGFFNPDAWSFGDDLHRSAIEGRLHQVVGVEHILEITMQRFNAPTPGVPDAALLEIGFDEVLLCDNDPSHLERGFVRFDIDGGRQ